MLSLNSLNPVDRCSHMSPGKRKRLLLEVVHLENFLSISYKVTGSIGTKAHEKFREK